MMLTILSLLLFFIFSALGGIHFYWFLGGTWGLEQVIPSKGNKASSLAIPKFATIIVGLVLVLFGLIYLSKSGILTIPFPAWMTNIGYWLIPIIFILRAVGEFKYVGFFKKIKNTEFAKADSKIFSPLCLGIGILGIVIQLIG